MENILKKIGKISSFASRYIGIIIIAFSCLAFFWRDGFAWMTNYTSVFLGVIMFGMGLTIRLEDFRAIFSIPLELYKITKDKKYLEMGLSYADTQWTLPANATPEEKSDKEEASDRTVR